MKWHASLAAVASVIAIASLPAGAQVAERVWRVGVLTLERPGHVEALIEGLKDLHYVQGRNLELNIRQVSDSDQISKLAAELVRLNPNVVVAGTGRVTKALQALTKTVPIVMATSGDAVAQGLVKSLARPGGNTTGFTNISIDLAAKRFAMLREFAPHATRIATVGCRETSQYSRQEASAVQAIANKLHVTLVPVHVGREEEFAAAFQNAIRQKAEAVLVFDCSLLPADQVVALINQMRVPAMYPYPRYTQAGGLASYGPDPKDQFRRAAVFVDKILRGARPADLPVEQPTKLALEINMRTAKTSGIKIPASLTVRADEIIE